MLKFLPRSFSHNPSLATPADKSKCFFLERHLRLIQSDLDSFFYSLEQFFVVYMEYVCVYIYTYTHVYVFMCEYIHIYVFMYTHVHVYIHTSTHIYKHSEHLDYLLNVLFIDLFIH